MSLRTISREIITDFVQDIDLIEYEIVGDKKEIFRNPPVPKLYELAIRYEPGTQITNTGALVALSGAKTGRSPSDKRVVDDPDHTQDIWWSDVNIKLEEHTFKINKERAIDWLNTRDRIFVIDAYAGWSPEHRIKVRVLATRAYHALFMLNMLIPVTGKELQTFKPDWIIYNAGDFPANRYTKGMTSNASVDINFASRELVVLGTQYAGEMKKGIFTVMNYLMPQKGFVSLHSSCNEGNDGGVSLFFGLSGTGKTTLSADPHRKLIGDDEMVWTDKGIFNIEGGCYAKCIDLKEEAEPEIYHAIRFGCVLENVVLNHDRSVRFEDKSITENTRASYPLEFIPNTKIPATTGHPRSIIMLTCDAFGVLPPVSKLSIEQSMYHFISGYTAKVSGTEVGVTEPQATFSPCFGSPFLVWHPAKYAELLAEKVTRHKASVYLVNTGWSGGAYGVGKRMKLSYTRKIIDAINEGVLANAETIKMEVFGFEIPKHVEGVPDDILVPKNTWQDKGKYDDTLKKLAESFSKNFKQYEDKCSKEILSAAPKI